ncbi:hypothetical protein SK128_012566 [Halocaridina rubra]|uniref:Uncharacterized protein n=1 Tax=Halocaridina rubra TaxID=373956 RepID=A0AAN8WJK5_HALRR
MAVDKQLFSLLAAGVVHNLHYEAQIYPNPKDPGMMVLRLPSGMLVQRHNVRGDRHRLRELGCDMELQSPDFRSPGIQPHSFQGHVATHGQPCQAQGGNGGENFNIRNSIQNFRHIKSSYSIPVHRHQVRRSLYRATNQLPTKARRWVLHAGISQRALQGPGGLERTDTILWRSRRKPDRLLRSRGRLFLL